MKSQMTVARGYALLVLTFAVGQLTCPAGAQIGETTRKPVSACSTEASQPSITVRSPERASTSLSLCDGRTLSGHPSSSLQSPVSLVTADFDEDGVPDLVSGSGTGKTGSVVLYRGNVNALWPYGPAIRNNPPAAFFPDGKTFAVPEAPDFMAAGDFDADGHSDLVTAQRGSDSLYLLRGNGHGSFQPAKRILLAGTVTALLAGEINRPDGLTDLIVAVNSSAGPRLLVFESPRGAMSDQPEIFTLPAPATAMALGRFDGNALIDLAVAAGNDLLVVHARDRKLASGAAERAAVAAAKVTVQQLDFAIEALTAGDFTGAGPSIAALGRDGQVHVLEHAVAPGSLFAKMLADPRFNPTFHVAKPGPGNPQNSLSGRLSPSLTARLQALRESALTNSAEWTERSVLPLPSGFSQTHPRLVTARVSGSHQEDLLIPDDGARQVHIVSGTAAFRVPGVARDRTALPGTRQPLRLLSSLQATSAPTAVLPMRLNQHGLSGLVISLAGQAEPILMPQDVPPANVFTVTNTSDQVIAVGPQFTGPDGSLRKAIYDANGADGTSSIVFAIPTSDPGYNAATGSFLIQPLSESTPGASNDFALPPINATITLDGYTQPGASPNTLVNGDNARILIQIDGSNATTPGGAGLVPFDDIGSTFRGLAFTGWLSGEITNGTESGAEGIEANGVSDYIEGNFFGTDVTGKAANSNRIGIFADNGPGFGSTDPGNIIGGTTPQARNILSGNSLAGILFLSTAIEAQLEGNFIGLDVSGATELSNGSDGAGMNGPTVTFGGTLHGDGNVISGNPANVDINDITEGGAAMDSQVQGNLLGTDATGTTAPSGGLDVGVVITAGPQNMLIGGTTPAARNIISGNNYGVYISDNAYYNTVQGNYIGTDITGSKAVANTKDGFATGVDTDPLVMVGDQTSAGDTTLGGSVPGAGNVISGNTKDGIAIEGSSGGPYGQDPLQGNTILGNLIGTDATGKTSIPNHGNGISLSSGATSNIIGATAPGSGNLIANNAGNGVFIDPGNGAAISGAGYGNNTVANTILSNQGTGVRVLTGSGNRISQNSIFANGALGIDIDIAGENANSSCNGANTGANNLQNSPVLTAGSGTVFITATATDPSGNTSEFSNAVAASTSGNMLDLLGTFNSAPSTAYTIEFFSSTVADASGFGQGQTYIGSTGVTTSSTCTVTVNDPVDLTQADVAVTLTGGANFAVGPDFGLNTYTGTVTNNGPATAHNVVFTDALPAGLVLSRAYCDVGFCQSPITTSLGTCSVSGQTITCNLGAMAPGATAVISIPVMATAAGSLINTATVTATEPDPNLANNSSTPTTTVVYPPPFLDHLVPSGVLAGSPDTVLTIYGSNLISSSTVTVNGSPVAVTALIDNQVCGDAFSQSFCSALQVVVPAALLTTAGTPTVEVSNPNPSYDGESNFPSDLTFTIAAACAYNIDGNTDPTVVPFFSPVESDGTDLIPETFGVDTNVPACGWTASSNVPWAVIVDTHNTDSSGNDTNVIGTGTTYGTGEVEIAFAPNTGASSRAGAITVLYPSGATQVVNFTEDGGATCAYALNPTAASPTAAGGTATVAVTTGSSCAYFVEAEAPWITVPQSSGLLVGSATATYTVAPNNGAPRTGSIMIGGDALTLTQAAQPCYFILDSNAVTLPVNGGTGTINVTASSPTCAYTATSSNASLVSVTSGASNTGSGTVKYAVPANTGGPQTPTITIGNGTADQIFAITQVSAFTCTFTLTPSTIEVSSQGTSNFVVINASFGFCKWTATSSDPTAVAIKGTGSGSGTAAIYYSVAQNATGKPRTLTITAGCVTFTINQDAPLTGTSNPVPTVTMISPTSVAAKSAAFSLTVNGTNFVSGSTVNFNGTARTTTFVSATQLTAAILATDVATAGTAPVTVTNATPGGGTSNSVTFTITAASNPVPTITTIAPTSVAAGSAAFSLTVNGTNFVSGSTVNFNGTARTTTFVSATQLTASITAAEIATAGTAPVTVTNATPGGGTSDSVTFTITAASNPVPTITTISPTSVAAGSAAFSLTVNGTNFVSGSTINFNGTARTTTYVSATQLTAAILATDVATAGTAPVTVTNATPGGGTSNSVTFTITAASNPVPTITTIAPTSVAAGSVAFSLTVNGTNFVSGSTVNFNGTARTTTFVSATQLTAAILATDVATAGTAPITVTNATPGGGTSNSVTFTITAASNPVPTITTISPTSVAAGSAAFSLTVNGTNFVSGSTVNFNGTARTTTYVSATQLTAAILATDVATAGTAPVTVTNATPGGGTSNSVTFTITAATAPQGTLTPTSIAFPDTVVATTSPAQTVTLTNSGSAALTVTGISLAGTNAADFTQTNNCPASLAAGAACMIQVSFTPSSAATFTATLSVADNASSSPQTVALNGTGSLTPSFNITAATASQTIPAGGAALYALTVSPQNGSFASAVVLTATGLPAGATATFSPASLTPGSAAASSQLTIQTSTNLGALRPAHPYTTLTAAVLPFCAVFLFFWRRRSLCARRWLALCFFLAASIAGAATLTGCGGGFSLPSQPAATYTITITGTSGSIQQSTTVQLTVQ